MPAKNLADALGAVDWNANVQEFLKDHDSSTQIAKAQLRIAVWAKQFENIDKGNAALCFVREMQVAGHQVAALIALGLYKSAAGAIRTSFETALYYTYFRTHPTELATLVRDDDYYVGRADLLAYHKAHTVDFMDCQERFGLVGEIKSWYSSISAIVHGQIPGAWIEHKSISDIKYVKSTLDLVVGSFCKGERLAHHLFLCTVGREMWDFMSGPAKRFLIAGLPGETREVLKIDRA